MKVIVLGSGSSGGTPVIGSSGWGNCDPNNPKNYRTRPSIIVEHNNTRILVDTSPDLRKQLLNAKVWDFDAILFTHAHADHVNGIDDVRALNYYKGKSLPVFATEDTLKELQNRFAYVFEKYDKSAKYFRPSLKPNIITEEFKIGSINITPFTQSHGTGVSTGFRFNNFSYSTDVNSLSENAFNILKGTNTWIVDCLSETPHPSHSHLSQSLEWVSRLSPKRAIFNHLSHYLDYDTLNSQLPGNVEPAYDGMIINISENN